MAEITAQLVAQLREKTSAGMMDCKRALKETDGDLEAAADLLRIKGMGAAVKRADREAKEGLVSAILSADGTVGAALELNCETDFVSKNEGFRAFVEKLAQHVLSSEAANDGAAAVLAGPGFDGAATLDESIKVKASEMGENLILRRLKRFPAAANSGLNSYIHMMGKGGVLLELSAEKAETRAHPAFAALGKDISMHICAANPEYVRRDEVPASVVEKEAEINRERMADQLAKKPEAIVAKILEGSISKFYSQICVLEQAFVKNPDLTIEQLVAATSKELGDTISIVRFARLMVGEELKA